MKELVVISGKGGTGKTTIVASFAAMAKNKVMVDCDVDAADLHLLLQSGVKESREFWSGQTAYIDIEKCTSCGLCQDVCRFNAIEDYSVERISCEGCGFCSHICPVQAITMMENCSGKWFISTTKYGHLIHARLGIAQENSGKLVSLVRQNARQIAEKEGLDFLLSDGPPGIGCPVISSLSGVDLALIITEPTLSGIHDLDRVLGVCRHFNVPALVCINKYDLNEENSILIKRNCQALGIELATVIPFDNVVTEALIQGVPVVEYSNGRVSRNIEMLWRAVYQKLNFERSLA